MKYSVRGISSLLMVFGIGALLASCDRNSGPSDAHDGSVTGVVTLGKENANSSSPVTFATSAGVTISLDKTTLSTTTDSSGFWKIDNVPAGNYDVTISKTGFGLLRVYGVTIQGPGSSYIPHIDLGEAPTTAPTLSSVGITTVTIPGDTLQPPVSHQELRVRWTTPLIRDYYGLCIYLDKDSLAQPADVHLYTSLNGAAWDGWFTQETADTTRPFSNSNNGLLGCTVDALHAAGIASGTKVYVTLAQYDPFSINGSAPNNEITYVDPVHNQKRLISPSPRSNVISVTIP